MQLHLKTSRRKLISIILPFYNAAEYLRQSLESAVEQSYKNWELLLINDGSTDQSKAIALSFDDSRICYFEQENKGVSAARNVGLAHMKGDYFCFLDADDVFPIHSLETRYNLLKNNPSLTFADGIVKKFDQKMSGLIDIWTPNFKGEPLHDLVSLSGRSFFGPSWMVRRYENKTYRFNEDITHSEDLLFFMELARTRGSYDYTDEPILHYRVSVNSAMSNLGGLEKGYRYIEKQIKTWGEVDRNLLNMYIFKYRRAMFLAYLKALKPINAIKSMF